MPSKRSSIENLKRASRVKNSNMFAREQKQEYDPRSTPVVERPLAAGRPLTSQTQNNFLRKTLGSEHHDQLAKHPVLSPTKSPSKSLNGVESQTSPTRGQTSPGKSSLSKNSRYGQIFDPENGMLSEDDESFADRQLPPGKSLQRHAKSVTFDAAPPQVNEYEMTTPDPSSVASGSREGSYDSVEGGDEEESFEHGSINHDDSFDASLEDTDKTPVVLPEDWRFMSPAIANDELAAKMDDPFDMRDSSPAPNAIPTPVEARASPTRTDSTNSSGERRPLPPLPPLGAPMFPRARSDSNSSLQATAERISTSQRSPISSPRPASISKAELQGMTRSSMSLEDRLRLMMLQEEEKSQATASAAEEQRERRLRRAGASPDRVIKIHEDEPEDDGAAILDDYHLPPVISRESILRKVKSQNLKDDYNFSSPAPSSSPGRPSFDVDPDTPLPSLEGQSEMVTADDGTVIKQEEDLESEVDVYAIPDMYQIPPVSSYETNIAFTGMIEQTQNSEFSRDDDIENQYSRDSNGETKGVEEPMIEDEGPPTPRVTSPMISTEDAGKKQSHRMSLPQFASMLGGDDFEQSLSLYMTPSPPVDEPVKIRPTSILSTSAATTLPRPSTPENHPKLFGYSDDEDEPSTPESVIRHPVSDESTPETEIVPEPAATIKAPGGKLRTRTSLAPADVRTMAETRRKVSGEQAAVPPIPQRHQNRPSVIPEGDSFFHESTNGPDSNEEPARQEKQRKSSLVQLDLTIDEIDEGLSFGLDREFDRVIEAQKVEFDPFTHASDLAFASPRNASYNDIESFNLTTKHIANISTRRQKGYLMRQNTKMVVASSASHDSTEDTAERHVRGTRSAGNSPTKQSGTWTTEPWNGKMRRKSIRRSGGGGSPVKKSSSGPAPPLPGMPSNVATGLDSVAESQAALESSFETDEIEDGNERGRLFVKVVGVKELDLPLPKGI